MELSAEEVELVVNTLVYDGRLQEVSTVATFLTFNKFYMRVNYSSIMIL